MKSFVSKLLIVVLTISITGEIIYLSITESISKEKIKESINQTLLKGLIYNDNGDKTEIFKAIMRITKLDEETVIKLMNNETANKYIIDIVNSIYDYNLTGDDNYKYKKQEITEIVEENIDQVLDEIDYTLSTEDKQEVIDYTINKGDYIIDTIYSTNIGDYVK